MIHNSANSKRVYALGNGVHCRISKEQLDALVSQCCRELTLAISPVSKEVK